MDFFNPENNVSLGFQTIDINAFKEDGFVLTLNLLNAQNQAETLYKDNTLLETMEMHSPPEMRTRLRAILGAFMFTGDDSTKKVSVLSGGERARLALACLLLKPFNILLLDEPTNHLDMISKEVLKEALMQYDGTLIVVSHDRFFIDKIATRLLLFEGAPTPRIVEGNWSTFHSSTESAGAAD